MSGGEGIVGEDFGFEGDAGAALVLEGLKKFFDIGREGEASGGGEGGVDGAEEIGGGFLDEEVCGDVAVFEEEVKEGVAAEDAEGGDGAAEGGGGVVDVGGEGRGEGDGATVPEGEVDVHGAREGEVGVE